MEIKKYQEAYEKLKAGRKGEPSWLLRLRDEAMASFAQKGFPSREDDTWRYTDLTVLKEFSNSRCHRGKPATASLAGDAAISLRKNETVSPAAYHDMIIEKGKDAYETGSRNLPEGVQVLDISEAITVFPELLEKHLGRHAGHERDPFTALNTGLFNGGTFIRIADGVVLKEPLRVVHVAAPDRKGSAFQPRTLILMEKGSKAVVLEVYEFSGDRVYFTNAVTEIVLEEGSALEHCKIQGEHPGAFHIAATQVVQRRASSFTSFVLSTGARLMRSDCRVALTEEGVSCELNGLCLGDKDQVLDHQTFVDHQKPDGKSDQFFKGLLAGNSRGVFNGRVMVCREAQRTDARQTNKNLLLSDTAQVDTQPQLEILADDVKCSHGATVGQLQEDALFYLRSRGIDEQEAGRILAQGFAKEAIERSGVEFMKETLLELVREKLEAQFGGAGGNGQGATDNEGFLR